MNVDLHEKVRELNFSHNNGITNIISITSILLVFFLPSHCLFIHFPLQSGEELRLQAEELEKGGHFDKAIEIYTMGIVCW